MIYSKDRLLAVQYLCWFNQIVQVKPVCGQACDREVNAFVWSGSVGAAFLLAKKLADLVFVTRCVVRPGCWRFCSTGDVRLPI